MRAQTDTYNVYRFEELSEEAQAAALDNCREWQTDGEWWDCTYEDAERIGLKITSFDLDRNRGAEGNFTCSAHEVAQNVMTEHGPECETYKTAVAFMEEWQPIFNNYMDESHRDYESRDAEDKLQDLEDEFLRSLLEDYSTMLQDECDYLQSDEAVQEMIEAGGYEFTEAGELV